MGVPARVLGRVEGGWHQAALAEGEQRGHFKNHLRHFCIKEAPSLLDPLKMPWGQGEFRGVARLRGQKWGCAGKGAGKPRDRGGGLKSRSAMLLAGVRAGAIVFGFAQTRIPHQRSCVSGARNIESN